MYTKYILVENQSKAYVLAEKKRGLSWLWPALFVVRTLRLSFVYFGNVNIIIQYYWRDHAMNTTKVTI